MYALSPHHSAYPALDPSDLSSPPSPHFSGETRHRGPAGWHRFLIGGCLGYRFSKRYREAHSLHCVQQAPSPA